MLLAVFFCAENAMHYRIALGYGGVKLLGAGNGCHGWFLGNTALANILGKLH
jgi:hypothetical protein